MPLSPLQRHVLIQYKKYKDKPPTIWQLLALSAAGYTVFLVLIAGAITFWLILEQATNAWFLGGAAFGFIGRDFLMLRKSVRIWPALNEVLDWKKVDERLATNDGNFLSETG